MPEDFEDGFGNGNGKGCFALMLFNMVFFILLAYRLAGIVKWSWHIVLLPIYLEMIIILSCAMFMHFRQFRRTLDQGKDAKKEQSDEK